MPDALIASYIAAIREDRYQKSTLEFMSFRNPGPDFTSARIRVLLEVI
jgi:hypothetical protein